MRLVYAGKFLTHLTSLESGAYESKMVSRGASMGIKWKISLFGIPGELSENPELPDTRVQVYTAFPGA
jgi:hypothetical protein